jgi:AcrR family transcriptional regulator
VYAFGVGNREALLAGAKRCLAEKGYTSTTARDIATAAGTSLAAIGYHFGSTDALLREALFAAVAEWGQELGQALSGSASGSGSGTGSGDFEAIWTSVIESLPKHRRLWSTQFELIGQMDRLPQLHDFLVEGQRTGRAELAGLFGHTDPATAGPVGALYQALLAGVMVQWLVDPEQALTAPKLADALRIVAAALPGAPAEARHSAVDGASVSGPG